MYQDLTLVVVAPNDGGSVTGNVFNGASLGRFDAPDAGGVVGALCQSVGARRRVQHVKVVVAINGACLGRVEDEDIQCENTIATVDGLVFTQDVIP